MIVLDDVGEGQAPVGNHSASGRPTLESPDLITGQNSSEQANDAAPVAQSAAVTRSGASISGWATPTASNPDLIATFKDHALSGFGKN